jgi:hypothetical protein
LRSRRIPSPIGTSYYISRYQYHLFCFLFFFAGGFHYFLCIYLFKYHLFAAADDVSCAHGVLAAAGQDMLSHTAPNLLSCGQGCIRHMLTMIDDFTASPSEFASHRADMF